MVINPSFTSLTTLFVMIVRSDFPYAREVKTSKKTGSVHYINIYDIVLYMIYIKKLNPV